MWLDGGLSSTMRTPPTHHFIESNGRATYTLTSIMSPLFIERLDIVIQNFETKCSIVNSLVIIPITLDDVTIFSLQNM